MRNTTSLYLLSTLLLSSCVEVPPGAYYNRGDPESLVDVSSEVIQLPLASQRNIDELRSMLRGGMPSRAELSCPRAGTLCSQAARLLDARGIPVTYATDGAESMIGLVYERTVAHDCENRYIDNSHNNHNLHPPTFGCSVAGNTVQMVTDKRQFTDPGLLDYPDAEKAVQAYGKYANPPEDDAAGASGSLLSTVSTQ